MLALYVVHDIDDVTKFYDVNRTTLSLTMI